MWYAVDFGTSNSLLTFVESQQEKPLLINLHNNKPILKSLIFAPEKNIFYCGSDAITKYQELAGEGRFFRSLKKFLPEPGFKGTDIFGRRHSIEDLIAVFLREMKSRADKVTNKDVRNLVLGRPALYSMDKGNDQLAEGRMRKAAELAGFERIEFCSEPVAAGLNVENSEVGKTVLICDFGGGTSDFTLIKTGNGVFSKESVLGLSGVFVAGDAIDGNIMHNFISPYFGRKIKYKVPMGDNVLSFPRLLLSKLCNPAHIAFLKERDTWETLKELEKWSLGEEDQKIFDQLFCLIEEQLGYPVYDKIEKSKIELGYKDLSTYCFNQSEIDIKTDISREDFELGVESELEKIFESLEKVFKQAGLKHSDIDEVRVTGGTGQMPIIQNRLVDLFGETKVFKNDVFESVVQGLGLYAQGLIESS